MSRYLTNNITPHNNRRQLQYLQLQIAYVHLELVTNKLNRLLLCQSEPYPTSTRLKPSGTSFLFPIPKRKHSYETQTSLTFRVPKSLRNCENSQNGGRAQITPFLRNETEDFTRVLFSVWIRALACV